MVYIPIFLCPSPNFELTFLFVVLCAKHKYLGPWAAKMQCYLGFSSREFYNRTKT